MLTTLAAALAATTLTLASVDAAGATRPLSSWEGAIPATEGTAPAAAVPGVAAEPSPDRFLASWSADLTAELPASSGPGVRAAELDAPALSSWSGAIPVQPDRR
jgi:hypothetical protein